MAAGEAMQNCYGCSMTNVQLGRVFGGKPPLLHWLLQRKDYRLLIVRMREQPDVSLFHRNAEQK